MRRKAFRRGLVGVVLAGGVFGYALSDWFLSFAPSYVAGLEGTRIVNGIVVSVQAESNIPFSETILVWFGLFGLLIWPAIFSIIYLLLGWWFADRHEAADWSRETQLQEERAAETARRIAAAKERGDLDKWRQTVD